VREKMEYPDDLKYSRGHIWVRDEGSRMVIGLTEFIRMRWGDILKIELPNVGEVLSVDDSFGVVQCDGGRSYDLASPVSGKVVETNDILKRSPEIVMQDPYDEGWMIKIESNSSEQVDHLLNSSKYSEYTSSEMG
jgi:glycine cleavage system H protein